MLWGWPVGASGYGPGATMGGSQLWVEGPQGVGLFRQAKDGSAPTEPGTAGPGGGGRDLSGRPVVEGARLARTQGMQALASWGDRLNAIALQAGPGQRAWDHPELGAGASWPLLALSSPLSRTLRKEPSTGGASIPPRAGRLLDNEGGEPGDRG